MLQKTAKKLQRNSYATFTIYQNVYCSFNSCVNKWFAEVTTFVDNLRLDITARNVKLLTLDNQNVKLCAAVESQPQRIEALEANTRFENLAVYGLPPSYAETSTAGLGGELNDDVNHPTESSRRSEKIFIDFCHEKLRLDIK